MRTTAAVWLVALGLVVAGCADGSTPTDTGGASSATPTVVAVSPTPFVSSAPVAAATPPPEETAAGGYSDVEDAPVEPDEAPLDPQVTSDQPLEPIRGPQQISGCGTDKNVHNRGTTFYVDGSWSPWTQYCADQFDAVNNPPNPPGTMGGGGAVAGPCGTGEEGVITYTPDGRKQQCSAGHWVYIR